MSGVAPAPAARVPAEFFVPLRRNLVFVALFCLSAAATALALTYVYSERYQAEVSIEYRPQEVMRLRAPEAQSFGSPVPAPPFKVISQTLQELVASETLMRRIVGEFDLTRIDRVYAGPWYRIAYARARDWLRDLGADTWTVLKYGRLLEQDPVEAAVGDLRNNVRLRNRDSYVFSLSVQDKSGERAARIADRIAELLVDKLRQSERTPSAARRAELQSMLQAKAGEIAGLRREIELLLTRNRVASLPTEIERGTERLSALELDRSKLDADIARARERLTLLAQKQALKRALAGGSATAAERPVEPISPEDFKRLASERVFDEVEFDGLRAKRASLDLSVRELSARLQAMPELQQRLDTQRMRLAAAERDYVQLSDAAAEADMRAHAVLSEVNVLDAAQQPSQPRSPIKVYHVGLAAVLGLIFSIGLVYLLTYFNVRIFFASTGVNGRRAAPVLPGEPARAEARVS